ncbi:hypothetical protein ACFO5R_01215 [Halosolutus amylolyticus]|uniref:HD domain-containing protein n=1 Tax=Halosolutus amylolyticus TaxID=2932267 RepID=A0ABD5PJ22_9EURY|nr:hypothetical protein [Halosolutus amylolyticus]
MVEPDDDVGPLSRRIGDLQTELGALRQDLHAADGSDDEFRARFESVAGELQDLLAAANGGHGAIDTISGETITPLDPDPAAIDLDDVAHALSNLSRFTGQGTRFYSVARHSVHVSREVEARGGSRAAQRWGLLHDAPEAYLSDVPAPVKRSLPGYTHAEKRLARAVRDALDVEVTAADLTVVDAADSAVGRHELSVHLPESDHESPPLEYDPDALESNVADSDLFRERARTLGLR